MLTIILGTTGSGKMQYGLTQTVEKSQGKKVLIVSNELSPEFIIRRLDKIYEYNPTISPAEVLIKSELNYSDLDFAKDYDIISILGYIPNASNGNFQAAKEVFMLFLSNLQEKFPDKEIMATIQIARMGMPDISFSQIKEAFFDTEVETTDSYNHVMIYRDPESEHFKILNRHTKEVQSISKLHFFCES